MSAPTNATVAEIVKVIEQHLDRNHARLMEIVRDERYTCADTPEIKDLERERMRLFNDAQSLKHLATYK